MVVSTHQMARKLQAARQNSANYPIVQFTPAIRTAASNLASLITSGQEKIMDYSKSTAVGGRRGVGGRVATRSWPRPVMYVPESQRDQVLAVYDSAYSEAKRKSGSKIFQLSRAEAIARGLPSPTRHDVQDSVNFDVYEALCRALGVPLGTNLDVNVFNSAKQGLRDSGMTREQIEAEMRRLNIQGDLKTAYYGSKELAYQNPNSRFYNVPYKDVLKGSVLTALGVIPRSNRNMTEVLRELEQQSTVEASGSIPRQTAASVTSLEARKAELASETPTEKKSAPDVSEPAGSPKDSSEDRKKKKSNTLLYGTIIVGVLAAGGLTYWYMQE